MERQDANVDTASLQLSAPKPVASMKSSKPSILPAPELKSPLERPQFNSDL